MPWDRALPLRSQYFLCPCVFQSCSLIRKKRSLPGKSLQIPAGLHLEICAASLDLPLHGKGNPCRNSGAPNIWGCCARGNICQGPAWIPQSIPLWRKWDNHSQHSRDKPWNSRAQPQLCRRFLLDPGLAFLGAPDVCWWFKQSRTGVERLGNAQD